MNADAIPAALKQRDQWVVWKPEIRDGRPTKSPWRADDPTKRASSTDPATWGTFAAAVSASAGEDVAGIGYVFSPDDPFVGVDVDSGCDDKRAVLDALASYTEVSPSGDGFHVIVRAEIEQGRHPAGIGIFAQGRYFTVTGDRVSDYPATIEYRHTELQQVIEQHLPAKERRQVTMPVVMLELDDHELIERARNARNGPKFRALYDSGDVSAYASPSEADLALCDLLAFWTGPNPAQLDRLFRSSALMRDKWDRDDYAQRTIVESIEGHAGAFWESRQPQTPAERVRRDRENQDSQENPEPVALILTQWPAFAEVHEPGPDNLLGDDDDCVLPADGTLVFYGTGGAGKTTLEVDLLMHLAAGRDWQGLECKRELRVLAIENEGPRRKFRDKLARKLEAWEDTPADETLWILEEPWGVASLSDVRFLNALADRLNELQVDVLAAGPVNRLGIRGGGTPDEVSEFMAYVEALRQLVHHPLAVMFAHHTNKAGSVSGAWEGVPDTLVHVKAAGNGITKVIWDKVRWGSNLHGKTWDLGWRPGAAYELLEKEERTDAERLADMIAFVGENPETGWRSVRGAVLGTAQDLARVRDEAIASGALYDLDAGKRTYRLVLPADAARFGGSAGSTPIEPGETLFSEPATPMDGGGSFGSGPLRGDGTNHEPDGASDGWNEDADVGF